MSLKNGRPYPKSGRRQGYVFRPLLPIINQRYYKIRAGSGKGNAIFGNTAATYRLHRSHKAATKRAAFRVEQLAY